MLSAFDQSLSSMANRMHQINLACEHKDRTIEKLSRTIEELRRKQGEDGGGEEDGDAGGGGGVRRESSESAGRGQGRGRVNSYSLSSTLPQWSRKSGSCDQLNGKKVRMRSCSRDGKSSNTGAAAAALTPADSSTGGWIRQSISRAFRKSRTRSKSGNESGSDGESLGSRSNLSCVTDANGCVKASTSSFSCSSSSSSSPPSASSTLPHQQSPGKTDDSPSRETVSKMTVTKELDDVTELKLDVQAKERALTDLRLESLSMAHQMDNMKEAMVKMKSQMDDLLSDNLRLQLLLSASKAAAAATDKVNSSSGNECNFPTSPVKSCDQVYSQNASDPLVS